mgnify:CR=1 FL=1
MGGASSISVRERWGRLPSRRKYGLCAGVLVPGMCLYVAVLAVAGAVWWGESHELFHENAPGTWMSVTLLFVCAAVAWSTRERWRRAEVEAYPVWTHATYAFLIAALDDWFRFHESLDNFRAWLMGIDPKHMVWGNLDYALVALYGVYLLIVAWKYRRALLAIRPLVWFGSAGAVVFAGMVFADAWRISGWLEDGLKLIAIALFLAALLAGFWRDK